MIPAQDTKFVSLKLGSVATNATATANIDTLGYQYLTVVVDLDTQSATSSNPAVLKLSESDDTVVTNFADISGFVGDTDFTIPIAETTKTEKLAARFDVDLRNRKRYIRFSLTSAGAAQIAGALAMLSRAQDSAESAADRGAFVSVVD